jgi:hypothetical protein
MPTKTKAKVEKPKLEVQTFGLLSSDGSIRYEFTPQPGGEVLVVTWAPRRIVRELMTATEARDVYREALRQKYRRI